MQERKRYQKPAGGLDEARLRKEWVELENGPVCVWELSTPEMLAFQERCQRPACDPRGGVSEQAATGWLVAFSARYDDQPKSQRIWDDLSYQEVYDLRFEEVGKLVAAARRVCGIGVKEIEAQEAFTPATGALKPSGSTSSASSTSAASRRRSTSPITS